jgi:23S rRNA (uracil1939-C5)-methyltransferase
MSEAEVTIERMCYGGAGFGRLEGKACFVPFSAPGDRARIRVVKEKRSFLEGELLELPTPSPLRVAPACPLFGRCGGCNWQHLPYEEQLRQKGDIFGESLRRIGRVESDALLPVAGSPAAYGYRSRIQLKLSRKGGSTLLGFFQGASHQVVDAPMGCAIADPLLNQITAEFRALLPGSVAETTIAPFRETGGDHEPPSPSGLGAPKPLGEGGRGAGVRDMPRSGIAELSEVSQIDLAIGDNGESVAVLHLDGKDPAPLSRALLAARAALPSVSGLFLRVGAKSRIEKVFGVESLSYRIPAGLFPGSRPMELRFGRGGFSQVNYPQNLRLIQCVFEMAELTGTERVLDLYCGNGNISVPIAPFAGQLLGIEGYAPSIDDARANAQANGVHNATFQVSDAALAVGRLAARGERFDLVILDPPRSGAEAAGEIARLAPKSIIYVSCDPPTLSRDLAHLGEQGYRVVGSQPVDMFPQTYHLESVTLLKRL